MARRRPTEARATQGTRVVVALVPFCFFGSSLFPEAPQRAHRAFFWAFLSQNFLFRQARFEIRRRQLQQATQRVPPIPGGNATENRTHGYCCSAA